MPSIYDHKLILCLWVFASPELWSFKGLVAIVQKTTQPARDFFVCDEFHMFGLIHSWMSYEVQINPPLRLVRRFYWSYDLFKFIAQDVEKRAHRVERPLRNAACLFCTHGVFANVFNVIYQSLLVWTPHLKAAESPRPREMWLFVHFVISVYKFVFNLYSLQYIFISYAIIT